MSERSEISGAHLGMDRESAKSVRPAIREADRLLRAEYGVSRLGNKDDPLDELVFIILSTKTREETYFATFDALKSGFADWKSVAEADTSEIADYIKAGGLAAKKACSIKSLLEEVIDRTGEADLNFLRGETDEDAESFLCSLPGVGIKTARCVLSYSLGRDVFAVDANVERMFSRLGWSEHRSVTRRVQDDLQDMIPAELRLSLHVNLVVHGRLICTKRNPRCNDCVLAGMCPSAHDVDDRSLSRRS